MQDELRALKGLQELDRDLFKVEAELKRLPQERDRRRADIDLRLERVADFDRRIFELRTHVKEIEDLTTTQRQRVRKLENEASSNKADAALLAAYQHEIRSLRKQVAMAEEEGLEQVEQVDRLEADKKSLEDEIAGEEEVFAEYNGNIERELAEARQKHDVLATERKSRMSATLSPDILGQYNRLIQARGGVALAELDGRVCQGCYMEVPANVYVRLSRALELVQCPSCDRILYLRE